MNYLYLKFQRQLDEFFHSNARKRRRSYPFVAQLSFTLLPLVLVIYLHSAIYRVEHNAQVLQSPTRHSAEPQPSVPAILSTYDPSLHHIIPRSYYQPNIEYPLTASIIALSQQESLLSELKISSYLHVTQHVYYQNKEDIDIRPEVPLPPKVYFVEWDALGRDCYALDQILKAVEPEEEAFFVYIDLSESTRIHICSLDQYFDDPNKIRVVKRSIVRDRFWDSERKWIRTGQLVYPNQGDDLQLGGNVLHMPGFLRPSFLNAMGSIENIEKILKDFTRDKGTDISFFGNLNDSSHYSRLRRNVASVVYSLRNERVGDSRITVHVGPVSTEDDEDEGDSKHSLDVEPNRAYVEKMLDSKIVVVSQRDEWEDHFALMEALSSGALVFSDAMLAPPVGLENATNCIIYDSEESLRGLLLYYLSDEREDERYRISKRGWELAVGHHRSWHQIESVLFGKPMSRTFESRNE